MIYERRSLITLLNRILFSIVVGVAVTGLPFFMGPRVRWLAGILGTPGHWSLGLGSDLTQVVRRLMDLLSIRCFGA
jgi:hypothetical protein